MAISSPSLLSLKAPKLGSPPVGPGEYSNSRLGDYKARRMFLGNSS
jgi:hypothetical protein